MSDGAAGATVKALCEGMSLLGKQAKRLVRTHKTLGEYRLFDSFDETITVPNVYSAGTFSGVESTFMSEDKKTVKVPIADVSIVIKVAAPAVAAPAAAAPAAAAPVATDDFDDDLYG